MERSRATWVGCKGKEGLLPGSSLSVSYGPLIFFMLLCYKVLLHYKIFVTTFYSVCRVDVAFALATSACAWAMSIVAPSGVPDKRASNRDAYIVFPPRYPCIFLSKTLDYSLKP